MQNLPRLTKFKARNYMCKEISSAWWQVGDDPNLLIVCDTWRPPGTETGRGNWYVTPLLGEGQDRAALRRAIDFLSRSGLDGQSFLTRREALQALAAARALDCSS